MSAISYPDLPITQLRRELLDAIRDNQVVVVAGETGSGKSTQLPKLCLELGRGNDGLIGHTQPRRIAARSIAERIAEELGSTVGETVGYTVRFTDQVGENTKIKVMTDGILLNETHRDRMLSGYDTIIIDEAHERSLNIDFLLGYLKRLLPSRLDLKVIITSATIDTERFSEHFGGAPVIEVSGRTYPVDVRYRPLDDPTRDEVRDQPQGICDAVEELFTEGDGDILVFCSGEREIRDAVDALEELRFPHTEIVPMYGRLSAAEQHRVFEAHVGRRVVVATNVAETSLTVPGIRYVVDCGTARISRFSKRTKVQRLPIEAISQASANQRAGRCGRLGPGIAVRLYAEDDYLSRPEFTEPEVQRTQLASVMLQMAALRLGSIEDFPFLDAPDRRTIRDGVMLLVELGAVDPDRADTSRWVTKIGQTLSRLPVDVRLGRMLVAANENGSLREVLQIVSALSIQDPRERPTGEEAKADLSHARFRDETSDFLSWLNLWRHLGDERKARSSNQFRKMCRREFLNYRRVREWQDIHSQLRRTVEDLGMKTNRRPARPEHIHAALLMGLLSQVGVKDPDGYEYRGARGVRFALAPGGTLFKRGPEWVMAGQLVETSRMWARQVAGVDPVQIEEAASHLIKRSYSDPWWDGAMGAAVANESVTLYGLPLQTTRPVQYGRINEAEARDLFIRHVLVAGEWEAAHPFVEHNRQVFSDALRLEARFQRADLLISDDEVVAWFGERIPSDVTTVRHFEKWWKTARHETPDLLDMTTDDLIDPTVPLPRETDFPEVWTYGDLQLPLTYGHPEASFQVDVPIWALERIEPRAFAWSVPGMRYELVETIVRGLPKRIRKSLAPLNETALAIAERAKPDRDDLATFVRSEIRRIGGIEATLKDLRLDSLPLHFTPSFRVVSEAGDEMAVGRDLDVLKRALGDRTRAAVSGAHHPIERSGMTTWDFGELPMTMEVGRGVVAYPAVVDENDSVGIRLVATLDEQGDAMWDGIRRLMLLNLPVAHQLIRLTTEEKLTVATSPYRNVAEWRDDCIMSSLGSALLEFGAMPFDGVTFDRLLAYAKDELDRILTDTIDRSLETLEVYQRVVSALPKIRPEFPDIGSDIDTQLAQLVYAGFVTGMSIERIAHVVRYLRAIEIRMQRVGADVARDRHQMGLIHSLESDLEAVSDYVSDGAALVDVAWSIQELRVSFFAQALGTDGSISEKRIRQRLAELA